MKRALLKDSIKEIKNTYKRFLSILLMAFLGVGFFAGLRAASPDMVDTIDKYYKDQNVYDIQVISTLGLTDEDIEELKKVENVDTVVGTYETDGKIEIQGKEVIVKLLCLEEVNVPVLTSGSLPQNANECVMEEAFLSSNGKQIGDVIKVEIENVTNDDGKEIRYLKEKELTIVGTVKSPLYITRDRGNSSLGAGKVNYYMYIPKENVNSTGVYTNIYVKVKNEKNLTTFSKKYENYIGEVKENIELIKEKREKIADVENSKWYVLDRYSNSAYNSFSQDTQSIENISKVFPIVFFIVAALISLTSMTRMVEEQRTQIGTLKALGYNKFQIASKYIIYASLACVIGGFLGMCLGFVILPKIIWEMYMMMYQMTDNIEISFNLKYGGIGLLLISVCIIGATIYSVMKELASQPAVLMRPKAPKMGKRVFLERITFVWRCLNFSGKVTVRNIFRYKKRFLMTIIGICGCTSLILTGFGIKDSISGIMPNQFEKVFDYDMQISLKDGLEEEQRLKYIQDLSDKTEIQKVVQTYMTSATLINGEYEEDIQIIVPNSLEELDGTINIVDVKTKEKVVLDDNEICLTDKVAELLGVKQGDMITLRDIDENEVEVRISNVVENYISHYVYMSKILYEKLYGEKYETNVLLVKNNELTEEAEESLVTEIMNQNEVSSVSQISRAMGMLDDTLKSLDYVVMILIVSAGLLAFVVLYNLSNVNISERIRELATIKVLGFYDKEVYSYVTRETVILTIIGIVLGLVGGYFLNYFIIGTCEINMLRFAKIVNPMSYVYSILITVLFTVIVNVATYFALKKIDMIESLKSVE